MPSFDILHNLTGRDINAYLLKTRDQFYKRRYGGFEFGVKNPLANRNFTLGKEAVDRWLKVREVWLPLWFITYRFGNISSFLLFLMPRDVDGKKVK